MQHVWFNKTFSSVAAAISLIREADLAGDYHIVSSHTNPYAASFQTAHQFAVEPSGLQGEAYLAWCLQFCLDYGITIFIPGKEAVLISAECERFEQQGTRVLSVASAEMLALLHDKAAFYQAVDLPHTPPAAFRVVETAAQFEAAYQTLRQDHARLCIKPAKSVFGLGFAIIDEERSSAQLLVEGVQYYIGLDDLRRGFAAMGTFKTMIVMEYLDGHEYSVDCVGDHGRLVCAVPRKKMKQAGRGQMIEMRSDILDSVRQLAEAFGLNGNFNVQFKERAGGLGLLEINPRMSGGIAMACLGGPNLPYLALAGFDRGFGHLHIPEVPHGIRVAELGRAAVLLDAEELAVEVPCAALQ
ncbi:ATP-grasp domain-containing protein [Iodobacter fluviatilis]|uniref:ATP-grasp domain-containing protein n=1 Tax=Iodobacter fluviatilis TaxID=537 RepID=A0A377Q2J5_9NEIS|nr:ATP-grasp domain-containing protein [Iodobacter fluviatilis]TCU90005.1 ATP-grasp domain-containing protein [Iodobacter fluviatilis]STQ89032.1 Carbamoyl-phosphate synthase arginine-specific large chain [Iodobacter fluviatilis]